MRIQLRQGDKGWLAVLGVVVVAELVAADDEMLSHAAARYRRAHPVVTTAIILGTAGHLLEAIPSRWDPFHRVFGWLNRLRRHKIQQPTAINATANTGT